MPLVRIRKNKRGTKVATVTMKVPSDNVNNPTHYQSLDGIEAIDVIESFDLGFHLGNVVKYLLRADEKNETPLEDLKKAVWYLARHLKHDHGKILRISKEGKVTFE